MKQFLGLILFLIVLKTNGQELWQKEIIKFPPTVCFASHEVHKSFIPPPLRLKDGIARKSVILVDYFGFPDEAKPAFQYAVDIWKDLIYSPIPIHIKVTWETLASDVLGSCSPSGYYYNFNSTQIWNCYYPVAMVEKMLGKEINQSSDYEIEMSFNKSFTNWYFGTDGATPTDKYDFVTTVLHELAHGLGFHGYFYAQRGRGGYGGNDGLATVFDQFVINKSGDRLLNSKLFTNPSVKLYQSLTSEWLAFKTRLVTDSLPRLYAPATWDSGSSIYHLDDVKYPTGDANSLMTHAMGLGEANHNPGPYTLAIMYDMGWKSISIKHNQLKDIEIISEPLNVEAQIVSDYNLDSTKLYLMYSTNDFTRVDSMLLRPTDTATVFSAKLQPAQGSTVKYYFSAKDVQNRRFVYPSNSPDRFFNFTIGIDKIAPVITYEPVKYLLSSNPITKIDVEATDNIAVKSVKVDYFVNGGIIKELVLSNLTANHYNGVLAFPAGSVKGGDIVSYRIVATDASSQSNVSRSPATGFYTFRIEGIQDPVNRYVTSFDATNQDFIGSDFSISAPTGFDTPALNSAHPYVSPDTDNTEFNFSTILRYPVILNEKGIMTFDEIVLVEPGESGTKFGDQNFWDYVIVEGSKDNGITWRPLVDGYDSNLQKSWLTLWYSALSGNNSTAVPTKDLLVKHEINMLANGNFKTGDVILIRFRLFSDPYSNGWGWIIDNLAIQDYETAVMAELLSPGEVRLFPNPVTNKLNIRIEGKHTIHNLHLKVYNATGKMVYNLELPVESTFFGTTIDVSNLLPGLYLFVLEPEKGKVIARKIQIL